MGIFLIFFLIAVAAAAAVTCVCVVGRSREQKNYYDAAYKMIREQYLDDALKYQGGYMNTQFMRTMIYLKNMKGKKEGFVFDPELGIYIGRNVENTLCIRDLKVSGHHCRLYMFSGSLYIEDMGSSNGTWIKKGLSKTPVTAPTVVESGTKILFGDQMFKVIIFNFNTTVL